MRIQTVIAITPVEVLRRPCEFTQYTSIAFGQRCREAGVRPSMGSVGDCFDNAMCESFFATLECELLDHRRFKTQSEARMAVFEFIEGWYNPHRRHSALDYLSPINYQRNHSAETDYQSPTPSTEPGLLHRASVGNGCATSLNRGAQAQRYASSAFPLLSDRLFWLLLALWWPGWRDSLETSGRLLGGGAASRGYWPPPNTELGNAIAIVASFSEARRRQA